MATPPPRRPGDPAEPPPELRPATPERTAGSTLGWAIALLAVVVAAVALILML